jgi:hypothetical protein
MHLIGDDRRLPDWIPGADSRFALSQFKVYIATFVACHEASIFTRELARRCAIQIGISAVTD